MGDTVLLCHNYYQQPGGEDESFAAEGRLLESAGYRVLRYTAHNNAVNAMRPWGVARRTFWNGEAYRAVRTLIRREKPQILHCTNTFPLISPAVYYAARREAVAVVQALRNYRLLCPGALFLRDGRPCEDCLGRALPWPGVLHRCYRGSRAGSAVVAGMTFAHRALGTWGRVVDLYYTPSRFARRKFLQAGFPPIRVAVKPNFVAPDPGPGTGAGGYALFAGRLSEEKGIATLLAAWRVLAANVPLKIAGDGPLAGEVRRAADEDRRIQWLGRRSSAEVLDLVGDATCLLAPSLTYETFGRTVVEAFAKGTPAIASRRGALAELITHEATGFLCEPGDPRDVAAQVGRLTGDPEAAGRMRLEARREYETKYGPEANLRTLEAIYDRALRVAPARRTRRRLLPREHS
jgi:glycosyltransferase involved in cell wall biosynthesis